MIFNDFLMIFYDFFTISLPFPTFFVYSFIMEYLRMEGGALADFECSSYNPTIIKNIMNWTELYIAWAMITATRFPRLIKKYPKQSETTI